MTPPTISTRFRAKLNAAIFGMADLLLLTGIIFPSLLGLLFRIHYLPDLAADGSLSTTLAYALGSLAMLPVLGAFYILIRQGQPGLGIVLIILLIALAVRTAYVLMIDNALTSDYKTMWDYALSIVADGKLSRAESVQEWRTVPYLLPLAILSGGSRLAFEFANIFTTVGSGLLIYWITTNIAGPRAGVVALILVLFSPEPLFGCKISTHNIPGTFFMLASVASFFIGFRLWPRGSQSILQILLLLVLGSMFMGLADIQRSTGVFIYAALLTVLVIKLSTLSIERRLASLDIVVTTLYIITPILILVLMKSAMWTCCADKTSMSRTSLVATWGWIASYSGPNSYGEYSEYKDLQPILKRIPDSDLPGYALKKVANEYTADPLGIMRHYKHKSERLYNLGRQGQEYYGDSSLRQAFDAYSGLYAIVILVVSVFSLVIRMSMQQEDPAILLPILVIAWLATALIAFGEIQSSYIFAVWYIFPIYTAITLSRMRSFPPKLAILRQRLIGVSLASILFAVPPITVFIMMLHLLT